MYWPFISWIMNLVIMHHSDWQSHYVKSSWGVVVTNNLDGVVCRHGFESHITTCLPLGIELLCVLPSLQKGSFWKPPAYIDILPFRNMVAGLQQLHARLNARPRGFVVDLTEKSWVRCLAKNLQILQNALNTFKDKDLYGAKLKYLMIWSNRGKPWH